MSSPPLDSCAFTQPSFSLRNRVARLVWGVVYTFFFRLSPRVCHGWRAWLLRLFGASIGRGCHIYPRAVIWAPWNLICDDEVGLADNVILYNQDTIRLGYRVVVSQGSHLCTGTHNYQSPAFELQTKPISVADHAWICAECFVCPGVSIGEGAVIGARAVVTHNTPPWMVCAGHPCRPLKARLRHESAAA